MSERHPVQPGDRIEVMVGGKPRMTYIDAEGTQRFEPNEATRFLLRLNEYNGLTELATEYQRCAIPFDDYLEFYLSIGLSVSGFRDKTAFQHITISNPLWDYDKDLVLAPPKDYGINLLFPMEIVSQEEDPVTDRVYQIYPAIKRGDTIIGCSDVGYEGFAVAWEKQDGDWLSVGFYPDYETAEEVAHKAANLVLSPHQKRLIQARKFL